MTTKLPSPLRHVVIGAGAGVFNMHRPALQLATAQLVAVADVNPETGQARADELDCAFYVDHQQMLAETRPDVAVIIAPHPFHAGLAIDCLRAGCHVLVEKPIAVQVAEAEAMVAAAEAANRLLAVNFQQRHRPEMQAARRIMAAGQLGQIQRLDMAETWPRTARYYSIAGWRGTWAGEGGGVLMNQAPHNLDLICYLLGSPSRVVAWTRTLLHNIETEDTVQAMLEWPNGALGMLHISTAQSGQPSRLEITGTGGRLAIRSGVVEFQQFEPEFREHIAHSQELYKGPELHSVPVELGDSTGDHIAVYRNLHAAILHGEPLLADGAEGRKSLELANAMIYASHTRSEVELPLNREKYAELLATLKAGHKG